MAAHTFFEPLADDTEQRLVRKFAISLGVTTARADDTIHRLWYRIALHLGADRPDLLDSTQRLMYKVAVKLGVADVRFDDMEQRLLWKILNFYQSPAACCAGVHDNAQRLLDQIVTDSESVSPTPPPHPPTPPPVFSYTPDTAVIQWVDSAHPFGTHGDLAAFNATATKSTVTAIVFDTAFGGPPVASISNLRLLPALNSFTAEDTLLTSLDFSGCTSLVSAVIRRSPLTSAGFAGCSAVTTVTIEDTQLAALSLVDSPLLNALAVNRSDLASISIAGMAGLFPSAVITWAKLSVVQVNAFLVALDGTGLNNGTVDLRGQTPAAVPTGVGATAVTNLLGKGWIVDVDVDFVWAPGTASCLGWVDSGGAHGSANLVAFLGAADLPTVTSLSFDGAALDIITGLVGLNNLPSLQTLSINVHQLTALPLYGCVNLVTLDCNSGQLASIGGIDGCRNLATVNCSNNPALTALPLTACVSLATLDCNTCDITGTLDVSPCAAALTTLNCSSNANLTTLTLTGCTSLQTLDCSQCAITSLDLSTCLGIITVTCYTNGMTSINLTNCAVLDLLDCLDNSLTSIDLSDCVALTDIDCSNNSLTGLDVSNNLALFALLLSNNPGVGTLDVTLNTALTDFDCANCGLSVLDVSQNTLLVNLSCYTNSLSTLSTTTNTALVSLLCGDNKLTALDVSTSPSLDTLSCEQNRLTSLDVSANLAMKILYCYSQYSGGVPVLASLKIGNSTAYVDVQANDNALPTGPDGVDDVLNKLATNCIGHPGHCNLNTAATNASPTGGVANVDYVALTTTGFPPWVVNIN